MLWGDGLQIQTTINCRTAAASSRVMEGPSMELERIHGESNLNARGEGLRVLPDPHTERSRHRATAATDRASEVAKP